MTRVPEATERPQGREHDSMVMDGWEDKASTAGGFEGMKGRRKRKTQHGMRRGRAGKRGKERNVKKRKEKDLSFSLSIPAQLEEGPPGLLSS